MAYATLRYQQALISSYDYAICATITKFSFLTAISPPQEEDKK
ncbi:hypothetical protein [Trichormus sp. NMC-1]|nr:hypothetical protein [Trichormus sp. NMC-1]